MNQPKMAFVRKSTPSGNTLGGFAHFSDTTALLSATVDFDIVVVVQPPELAEHSLLRLRADPRYRFKLLYSTDQSCATIISLSDGTPPKTLREMCEAWGQLTERLEAFNRGSYPEMRKHRHAIQPRLIGWPNFLMTLYSGLFFQLVLPFIIFGYGVAVVFLLPPAQTLVLTGMVYLLYVSATALMYLLAVLLVSERPKQDFKLAPLILIFPAYMFFMRCWSGLAMLNDAWRRGHEETSMAPWWVLKRAKKF